MKKLFDAYLLAKPALRGWYEWGALGLSGIAGLLVPAARLPLRPYLTFAGLLLVLGGFAFHVYSERAHREAHQRSSDITGIVDQGMYAKIRHPLYLSLIVIDLGIALAFGVWWTLILAGLFAAFTALTALREERCLLARFPRQYGDYCRRVPWRMVPGLF
jgi:protein-S-isoprenylcysteine O-methyltransferase Ste14